MIVEERIVSYINSLEKENSPVLEEIEKEARKDGVPIIRKEMESFLRVMLSIKKPMRILELGTAVGYSAILMSECINEKGQIITIENYDKRIPIAKENIKKAGVEEKIHIYEGDAVEILPTLNEKYDVIFIDAAKGKYPFFLKEALRMIEPNGIIFADNILYKGYVMSDYNKHKQRTAVRNLREYIKEVSENPNLETEILEVGDGLAISRIK